MLTSYYRRYLANVGFACLVAGLAYLATLAPVSLVAYSAEATGANERINVTQGSNATLQRGSQAVPQSPPVNQPYGSQPSYDSARPDNRFGGESSHVGQVSPKQAGVNLLGIDVRRQVFSPILLSPNRQWMAFSEMRYLPAGPQVFARGYIAPLMAGPAFGQNHTMPEDAYFAEALAIIDYKRDVKIAKTQRRQRSSKVSCRWLRLGCRGELTMPQQPVSQQLTPANPLVAEVVRVDPPLGQANAFGSIIPVDWAANGSNLLMKQHNGSLYQGLQSIDTMVIDATTRQVTRFPQIAIGIAYYWEQRGISPALTIGRQPLTKGMTTWAVSPIGWQPGSSTNIELEGWQYTGGQRAFLGHWRLNSESGQLQMMSERYNPDWPVAKNGSIVTP